MNYLPPLTLFSSRSALTNNTLNQHLEHWAVLLNKLHKGEISPTDVKDAITINAFLANPALEFVE